MYRAPTSATDSLARFYQNNYSEGFTTNTPTDAELASLIQTNFSHSEKDFAGYIGVLAALGVGPRARLFDFGCSWGYGSWQLSRAGYEVEAYEISIPRRRYARERLNVSTLDRLEDATGPYDVFFSSHVLEHVPNPAGIISFAERVLKPGGWFISFTPNGCAQRKTADWYGWNKSWGFVHPNLIDDIYLEGSLRGFSQLFASSPYDMEAIEDFADASKSSMVTRLDLRGGELLFAAQRHDLANQP